MHKVPANIHKVPATIKVPAKNKPETSSAEIKTYNTEVRALLYGKNFGTHIEIGIDNLDASIVKKIMSQLQLKFRLNPKFSRAVKILNLYKFAKTDTAGRVLQIPRFGQSRITKVCELMIKNNVSPPAFYEFISFNLELTPLQKTIFDYIITNYLTNERKIKTGHNGCVVCMKPGLGKTFLAMGVILELQTPAAIIVPNTLLLTQWYVELVKYFGEENVGEYSSANKIIRPITILIINSACSTDFNGQHYIDFWSQFGLVIYDECHKYVTKQFSVAMWRAQTYYILGLTATPDERADKFDSALPVFLGPLIDMEDIPDTDKFEISNDYEILYQPIRYVPETAPEIKMDRRGCLQISALIKEIISDAGRNALIVRHAVDILRDPERNLFIFTDRREHVMELASLITGVLDMEFSKDQDAMVANTLIGGATAEEVVGAKNSRLIISTYQFSGVGLSISQMNSLILATPRPAGFKQIVGRIMRHGSRPYPRVIVDIIDVSTPLRGQYSRRKKNIFDSFKNVRLDRSA